MDKRTAVVFAMLAVTAVAVIVGGRPGKGPAPAATASAEARDAGPEAGAAARLDGGDGGEANPEEGPAQGEPALVTTDAGATLLDGAPAPALPGTAPKSVVFGVILVEYKGAQGASPNARSREAALELAKQFAAEAKTDFKAAVAKAVAEGNKGSMENAGHMPRGMLEPAPEYVLYSLPKDGVSEPVDTPRGFWIVRRIE
jgi:parvulin-like peptidyl-prolyl isomerase